MTVAASVRKAGPYVGNGVTTSFPFSFKVFQRSDVGVFLTDSVLGVETQLVLDSDYSVLLNLDQDAAPGGVVTYPATVGPTIMPATSKLTMIGALTFDQSTDITNGGRYLPQVIENAFDKVTILIQQLKEISGRTLQAAIGTTVSLIFPPPSSGKFLRWRSDLLGLENVDAGTDSMALQGLLADSAAAAHGAGMVGFTSSLGYPAATVGLALKTIAAKSSAQISINDYTGTSTAKTQAAATAAGTLRSEVYAPAGEFDVTSFSAPAGTQFIGPGQVVLVPGGGTANNRLLNTYADRVSYDLGKEYLYAFHATLYGFGRPNIYLYGDSTTAGASTTTAPFRPQDVLDASFFAQGMSSFAITNLGVDGTYAADWNPAAAIADANCRLLIVSYGINDASYTPIGDGLENFYNNMAAKLTTIRATRPVDTLAICLKASNSTNDWFNGRHQVWHERANGVYKRLAREFKCYFFDTYALWADSQGSVPWMDSTPYGGQQSHIHPTNLGNMWIWGKLADEVVPPAINQCLYNGFRNVRQDYAELATSTTPANMPYGMSFHRATSGGGWAYDGAVVTLKQADGVVTQRNIRFGNAQAATATRHGVSTSAWSAFTGVDNTPTLFNGWTNYDTVNFASASWYLDEEGGVNMGGVIKPSGALTNTVILTLPAWARPTKNRLFELSCNTGRCQAVVTTAGDLTPLVYSGTPGWVSLEAVRFKV